jgi:anti-sigma factor ChrR (cupin superfamily)
MSSPGGEHTPYVGEQLCMYALGGLPQAEVAAVEGHLHACSDCQRELQALRSVVAGFTAWPTDVLRPSPSLWDRLAERIAVDTKAFAAPRVPPRRPGPEWKDVGPGISCKLLATDSERALVSMLVRLAPGADYPAHRHAGVEELYMLDGELIVDEARFGPGDYRRGQPGSTDHRVWSQTGCTCVLITSSDDALLRDATPESQ